MSEDTCEGKTKLPVKHDWYQTDAAVVITVLVKNVQKESLKVDFTESAVKLNITQPEYETCELCFKLSHRVIPEQSSYKLTPSKVWDDPRIIKCSIQNKKKKKQLEKYLVLLRESNEIEIKLKKAEGLRWEKLEGDPKTENIKSVPADPIPKLDGPPSYPTSKKGKDWSVVEKEIKKQEAEEKPEGEEALNKLFQEIYGKGSDEVKRAMNKSYMESGGTVLSTNWEEIAKKKVDVKPPDGCEFKKWN